MEEKTQQKYTGAEEPQGESMFSVRSLMSIFVLNWQWFILSLLVCYGVAWAYLRYTTPVYVTTAKMLFKGGDGKKGAAARALTAINLGEVANSEGVDNEMELMRCSSIGIDVVKRLKLHTTYYRQGRIMDQLLYRTQPVSVDIDAASLDRLTSPISLEISYEGGKYLIHGTYTATYRERPSEQREINVTLAMLPARIRTAAGDLTFQTNSETLGHMREGETELVTIKTPASAAAAFTANFSVRPTSHTTTILALTMTDIDTRRASDYLRQLIVSYNEDANNDKDLMAARTEEFINQRLEKLNVELGATEGAIETYKKMNKGMDPSQTAGTAYGQSTSYEQRLIDMQTQLDLFNSIREYMDMPSNRYQTLPSNVGLTDQSATALINNYNQIVLERNKLLRTANETSPSVVPLTEQLDDLQASIRRAMSQARQSFEIQRNAMQNQVSRYNSQLQQTPTQERVLNSIGRQQEVRSGLYLMLLQKREENSISLAATADKGKLIEQPSGSGKVSPDSDKIYMEALGIGLATPFCLFLLLQLIRYKIEGRNDVERLTRLPILADIPVANDKAKTKAEIVVHENQNSIMEEVFRSLRTNLQFTLQENEKVVMLTSSSSGEGKTFIAANLGVSFALLGKRVALVGLDIRKPRLSHLFQIRNKELGLTNLLLHDDPTPDMVHEQMMPSGVNDNLVLLPAGPVPPNPAEIVQRPSLEKVFDILKSEFDYIIVDTAPVGLVTDTLSIGRVANATLFVCRADYTPKSAFTFLNDLSSSQRLPNASVIVNAVDLSKKKYGYYYGYGRYGRYGKYGSYKHYGAYGHYGHYGDYSRSHYGKKKDESIKR